MILAPDPDIVTRLLSANFVVANAMTAWAQALVDTTLYPLDPRPSWFIQLNQNLEAAHASTLDWLTCDGPSVLAAFPQSVINYANTFAAVQARLRGLVTEVCASPGKTPNVIQSRAIRDLLTTLKNTAELQRTTADGLQVGMLKFAKTVAQMHGALDQDIRAAQMTLDEDDKKVIAFQNRLGELQRKLGALLTADENAEQSAAITGATIVKDVFLVSLVAIVPILGPVSFVGMAVAGLSIGFNLIQDRLKQKDVQEVMGAITETQVSMTAEQQQIAALQGILLTLESLHEKTSQASRGFNDLVPLWADIEDHLEVVLETLDQPNVDLSLISAFLTLELAASYWETLLTRAGNIQASSLQATTPVTVTLKAGGTS